ncbi:MAG: FAD-dependent oxidoreductase, partial [Pseudomonadota bacterium]
MTSQSSKKAVVVGTGFGGLASAFELLAKGYSVTMLEAGDQPGGRARVFTEKGYVFDAGPTVITAPYLFDELFALVNEKTQDWIEFMPVDPFYRIQYHDGTEFDYVGD